MDFLLQDILLFQGLEFTPEGRLSRTPESMGVKKLFPYVEIFGGVGEVAQDDGGVFEIRRDRTHNIHTRDGMFLLAKMLCCTLPCALVGVEPTCSSFLSFVSVSTSKRSDDIWQNNC